MNSNNEKEEDFNKEEFLDFEEESKFFKLILIDWNRNKTIDITKYFDEKWEADQEIKNKIKEQTSLFKKNK
jgi:hypothetical protein